MIWKIVALGAVQNYTTGWVLHYVYLPGKAETHQAASAAEAAGLTPPGCGSLSPSRRRWPPRSPVCLRCSRTGGCSTRQIAGVSMTSHLTGVALVTLPYSFALTLIAVVAPAST